MSRRVLEVLVMGLLIMVTLSVAFQFQNQLILQEMLSELRDQRSYAHRSGSDGERVAAAQQEPRAAREPAPRGEPVEVDVAFRDRSQVNAAAELQPAPQPVREPADPAPAADEPPAVSTYDGGGPAAEPAQPEPEPVAIADAPLPTPDADEFEADLSPVAIEEEEDPADLAWEQHEEVVVACIRDLLRGDYNAVVQKFTPEMARRLPRSALADILDPVRDSHGALEEVLSHRNITTGLDEGLHAFAVEIRTTRDREMVFTVTVTENGQVAGLLMR